jgi:hypothetical protein
VFYLIADEETNKKLQINQAQYDHMLANAKKLEARLPGVKVMPTAARMTRKVYKRAFLGNELLQSGDAPIKGRFSWACITGETRSQQRSLVRPDQDHDVLGHRKHEQDKQQ